MMQRISQVLSKAVQRGRYWVLGILIPILLGAVIGIPKIDFQDGLRSIFDSESEVFANYIQHAETFSQSETDVLLLVETSETFDGASLQALRDFLLDAQFIPGVQAVHSIFSLRSWDAKTGSSSALMPFDLSDQAALDLALDVARNSDTSGFGLISDDETQTVVIVSLGTEMTDLTGPDKPLAELRALIDDLSVAGGLSVRMTGLLTARDEIISGLRSDQLRINALGALLGFVLSWMLFRSFSVAVLNSIVPVSALLLSLGLFGWLGFSINALTNALPVLVLVLASSDSIHMTFDLRRRLSDGKAQENAIALCLRDMAPPVVLTSVTTIIAFASLFFSDSPVVRELALTGCAGVFVALLTVLIAHPLIFSFALKNRRLASIMARPPSVITPSEPRFQRRPLLTTILGSILVVGVFAVLLPIQPSYRFMENIDEKSEIATVLKEIEEIAGPFSTLDLPVEILGGAKIDDPSVQAELTRLTKSLRNVPGVVSVVSAENVAEASGGWQNLPAVLTKLPPKLRHRLVSPDDQQLMISLRVFDTGSSDIQSISDRATRAIATVDLKVLRPKPLTGFLLMSAVLSDEMITQLTQSFLLAALVCPFLIGLWFRRFDFGLIAIAPNVLPIALVGAGLTVFDYDIQVTSALAMTIAFGIALDDSIHVFNRVHIHRAEGIGAAMNIVRPVLITTTLILSAGLAATQISAMPMIRFFGVLCIAVFFFALICDLILLPAMLRLKGRFRK